MSRQKGFTLIEMLIVVAVIGILASLVLVGLGPVQRQGRDARRISDVRQVQTGLELYFVKFGTYPSSSVWSGTGGLVNTLIDGGIGISNVPVDPTNAGDYIYEYGSDGVSYVIKARLEDPENRRLQDDYDGAATDAFNLVCADTATEGNYCVKF